jgi:HSP20 family protein
MRRREVEDWFWQVGNDLQRLNDELVRARPVLASGHCWEPRVDILEDSLNIVVKAEIAGVRGEDIKLVYIADRNCLLIKGIRHEEDQGQADRTGIFQLEIYYGEFQREVKLPDIPLNLDELRAQYRNGFLLIMIPKAGRIVVTKTVTIKKI